MKRYIVTEEELERLVASTMVYADARCTRGDGGEADYRKSEAVCRSRPVPDWATEFAGDPHNVGYVESWEFEEIPK